MPPDPATEPLTDQERASLAELYALLASCFEMPDEELLRAVRDGTFHTELRDRTETLGFRPDAPPDPDVADAGEFREDYLRTFEGFDGPYAPPAQSTYEEWWDGRDRGLLDGPARAEMDKRYQRAGISVPESYPHDHIALLLEYGSLLLESDNAEEYARFHAEHFGWLAAFRERIAETDGTPFYRWAGSVLTETMDRVETRLASSGTHVASE